MLNVQDSIQEELEGEHLLECQEEEKEEQCQEQQRTLFGELLVKLVRCLRFVK